MSTAREIDKRWVPELPDDVVEELIAEVSSPPRETLLAELRRQLADLSKVIAKKGEDVQARQMAFEPFKETVLEKLWDLYEPAGKEHRQIALQLQSAVRKLSSLDVQESHLAALRRVLERLDRDRLTRQDVIESERTLRDQGLEILMDLGRFREPLLAIYAK